MDRSFSREPMLDMFIFETVQLVEQLEQLILNSEKQNGLETSINEIFRIMHTIKGSAAMMFFTNISSTAHSIEDVFFFLREERPKEVDYSRLTDIVLESIDFIKAETAKIQSDKNPDGDPSELIYSVKSFLSTLKKSDSTKPKINEDDQSIPSQSKFNVASYKGNYDSKIKYKAVLYFEEGCEMENIRAFSVVYSLKEIAEDIQHIPEDIIDNEESAEDIRSNGFHILFSTEMGTEQVKSHIEETLFLKELKLELSDDNEPFHNGGRKKEIFLDESVDEVPEKNSRVEKEIEISAHKTQQSYISVSVAKMDKLMDLMGELVISEAMVAQNPDLRVKGLQLNNFNKAVRQHHKIINELQDIVMSARMVPLAATFQKMTRIVRDMCKKLNKDVSLEIIGEETEVDKNIIEHISDPLMHLIRNSIDHGIEHCEERLSKGKPKEGKIVLEAKNAGGDVWIIVKDDGKGLDRDRILKKALEGGLTNKTGDELTDKEIYSFIMLPGFSTKENVTEFSGRGVGMDVVAKNIESIGGSVIVDSKPGEESTISIKIPLTLAIIDGMIVRVGNSTYTIPTISIKESFRVKKEDIIRDIYDNEMMMVRGECYPVIRLHQIFKVKSAVCRIDQGIITMVESNAGCICLFADALIGEQQVVVKAVPQYIKTTRGISGCTLLGDGSISLILDIAGLVERTG